MMPMSYSRELIKYLGLRRQKGFLTWDFMARSARFNVLRLMKSAGFNSRSPLIVTMSVTSRCPLNCDHCSEGYKDGRELPAEVIKETIDRVAAAGSPVIALTGGEPLLRKELIEFLDRVPPYMIAVIYTSGMGLTPELSREMRKRKNLLVCFSLDHGDEAEHDRLRGRKGSYRAVMDGLEALAGSRAELHVSSLATRQRVRSGELVDFARSMKKKGVTCVQYFQPRPVGRLSYDRDLYLEPWDEERIIRECSAINHDPDSPFVMSYPAMEHPHALGCCGGYARVYIDSDGHVCPCDFNPLSFGSVRERSFTDIWTDMRDFFDKPGSRCMVKCNRELFQDRGKERNVEFRRIKDSSVLRSEPPHMWKQMGEASYRFLLSNLVVASIACADRLKGAGG